MKTNIKTATMLMAIAMFAIPTVMANGPVGSSCEYNGVTVQVAYNFSHDCANYGSYCDQGTGAGAGAGAGGPGQNDAGAEAGASGNCGNEAGAGDEQCATTSETETNCMKSPTSTVVDILTS